MTSNGLLLTYNHRSNALANNVTATPQTSLRDNRFMPMVARSLAVATNSALPVPDFRLHA
jgi:hypothetical protein